MKRLSILFLILSIFLLTFSSCKTPFGKKIFSSVPKEPKFTVSLNSRQVPLGNIEMQRDKRFSSTALVKEAADVIYFPEEDAVCIKYKSDFFNYHLFLDRTGRLLFLNALEKYMAAYEIRDLPNNNKKTGNIYGSAECYLTWQEFKFTKRFSGNMNIEAGYRFNKGLPYFLIIQNQSEFIDTTNKSNNTASQQILIHFTRAQAQELAAFFNEEALREHAVPRIRRDGLTVDVDAW